MAEQLLLFEECIEEKQNRKIERLKESQDVLRKSLHAKNGVLQKKVNELERKLEFLEAHICKGNLFL
jgi:polyhydroxyalkanoate synthesis regulator phasin